MIRTLAVLVTFALASIATAQPRHAAYGEIGGSGVIPTANYERRFSPNWAGHIGLGVVAATESGGDSDITFAIPVVANFISHASSRHHFEAGGGVLFVAGDAQDFVFNDDDEDEDISNFAITGLAGYRYQRPDGGFVFRASFTPVAHAGEVVPWGGVSFGYAW